MKKIFLLFILSLSIATSHIIPTTFLSISNFVAYGAGEGDAPPGGGEGDAIPGIENPIGLDTIQDLLAAILSAIVQIAIPFLVLAVMWVGFLFVAARGNPNKLADARQALFYTLLGALIILGAQTLSVILSGTISQLTEGVGN